MLVTSWPSSSRSARQPRSHLLMGDYVCRLQVHMYFQYAVDDERQLPANFQWISRQPFSQNLNLLVKGHRWNVFHWCHVRYRWMIRRRGSCRRTTHELTAHCLQRTCSQPFLDFFCRWRHGHFDMRSSADCRRPTCKFTTELGFLLPRYEYTQWRSLISTRIAVANKTSLLIDWRTQTCDRKDNISPSLRMNRIKRYSTPKSSKFISNRLQASMLQFYSVGDDIAHLNVINNHFWISEFIGKKSLKYIFKQNCEKVPSASKIGAPWINGLNSASGAYALARLTTVMTT